MWRLYSFPFICLCLCSNLSPAIADGPRHRRQTTDDVIYNSINSKNGSITSPQFPHSSTSHEGMRYRFVGRPEEHVQIIFDHFDLYKLHPGEKCGRKNSFLSYDRELGNTVFICGPRPLQILSEKSEFVLEYAVPRNFNGQEEFRGFNATYKFITNFGVNSGKQIDPDQCHFEYDSADAKSGTFNSPNFPGFYPSSTECTYKFHGTEKSLKLDFTKFNLLGSNNKNCSSATGDVLELTETTNSYESYFDERRCGKHDRFSITVKASSFTVLLVSSSNKLNDSVFNEPDSFVGFQANFEFTNGNSSGLSNFKSPGSSLHLLLALLCLITSSRLGLRFI